MTLTDVKCWYGIVYPLKLLLDDMGIKCKEDFDHSYEIVDLLNKNRTICEEMDSETKENLTKIIDNSPAKELCRFKVEIIPHDQYQNEFKDHDYDIHLIIIGYECGGLNKGIKMTEIRKVEEKFMKNAKKCVLMEKMMNPQLYLIKNDCNCCT